MTSAEQAQVSPVNFGALITRTTSLVYQEGVARKDQTVVQREITFQETRDTVGRTFEYLDEANLLRPEGLALFVSDQAPTTNERYVADSNAGTEHYRRAAKHISESLHPVAESGDHLYAQEERLLRIRTATWIVSLLLQKLDQVGVVDIENITRLQGEE